MCMRKNSVFPNTTEFVPVYLQGLQCQAPKKKAGQDVRSRASQIRRPPARKSLNQGLIWGDHAVVRMQHAFGGGKKVEIGEILRPYGDEEFGPARTRSRPVGPKSDAAPPQGCSDPSSAELVTRAKRIIQTIHGMLLEHHTVWVGLYEFVTSPGRLSTLKSQNWRNASLVLGRGCKSQYASNANEAEARRLAKALRALYRNRRRRKTIPDRRQDQVQAHRGSWSGDLGLTGWGHAVNLKDGRMVMKLGRHRQHILPLTEALMSHSEHEESQHPESSDFAEHPHSKVTYGLWHVNLKPIAMNNQSRPKSPSFASLYVFLWHFMPLLPALLMTRICWTIGTLNLGRRLGGCTDIAELLIESRADVNAEAGEGWSSALRCSPSINRERSTCRFSPHARCQSQRRNNSMVQPLCGDTHTVNLLLQNGAECQRTVQYKQHGVAKARAA
ncbi:hypothetical protein B0H13DRAFT_1877910 [Mycena leptocephala]|nr:hypothetical protein B0H13DRAFT_1877910 [Mycena leptocephala]